MDDTHIKRLCTFIDCPDGSSGLGDVLVMMLSSRTRNDLVYVLPETAKRLVPLFEGIAPVMVRQGEKMPLPPGQGGVFVRLTEEELNKARTHMTLYAKPIALVTNCNPRWKKVREREKGYWLPIVAELRKRGHTILQFGVSGRITPLPDTIPMADMQIRDLAAHYAVIGQYVGVDTGDRHLATAAGARTSVLCPPDGPDYPQSLWHYRHELVRYYLFDHWERMLKEL